MFSLTVEQRNGVTKWKSENCVFLIDVSMFKKPRKAGDTLNITPDKTKSKLLQRSREKFWSNWSKFVRQTKRFGLPLHLTTTIFEKIYRMIVSWLFPSAVRNELANRSEHQNTQPRYDDEKRFIARSFSCLSQQLYVNELVNRSPKTFQRCYNGENRLKPKYKANQTTQKEFFGQPAHTVTCA